MMFYCFISSVRLVGESKAHTLSYPISCVRRVVLIIITDLFAVLFAATVTVDNSLCNCWLMCQRDMERYMKELRETNEKLRIAEAALHNKLCT